MDDSQQAFILMDDFQQALLEHGFLNNTLTALETELAQLRPQVKNNLGSGMYQRMKDVEHDRGILRKLFDENASYLLSVYAEQLDVEFMLLKK